MSMNEDEIIKALRSVASDEEIVFNVEGANEVADLLEQYKKDIETLNLYVKIRNEMLDKYTPEIVPHFEEIIKQLQAENDQLKANQPVRCGECKHWKDWTYCSRINIGEEDGILFSPDEDFYCRYSEDEENE